MCLDALLMSTHNIDHVLRAHFCCDAPSFDTVATLDTDASGRLSTRELYPFLAMIRRQQGAAAAGAPELRTRTRAARRRAAGSQLQALEANLVGYSDGLGLEDFQELVRNCRVVGSMDKLCSRCTHASHTASVAQRPTIGIASSLRESVNQAEQPIETLAAAPMLPPTVVGSGETLSSSVPDLESAVTPLRCQVACCTADTSSDPGRCRV